MSDKSTFYLVREEILPEAIKKTIKVKEILKRGEIKTINEAVERMGLSRSAYYKYKDYVSRNGKPKYTKIKNNNTYWDTIFMLINEDENSCRYLMNGRSFIICDSSTIKSELLWLNGQKNTSLGKITYEEATEDDLIDWMYVIASTYYIRDIQPMEQERLKEQEKKEFKSSFAKNFFKL